MMIRTIVRLAAITAAFAPTLSVAQFYGHPPDEHHPWAVHDMNRPQPDLVVPGDKPGDPPSDAIVLFDGTKKSFEANWLHDRENRKADWEVKDGALQSVKRAGYIRTKKEFGDCQLHIEWASPSNVDGDGQGRGNSGVFLMGTAEVQVLDNFNNPTYPDGSAGSVYGVMPPMVNPLRGPGVWQTYDIVFRRPIYKDGKLVDEGSMTVFVNGVLLQDSTPLEGGGGHKKRSQYKPFPEVGPLKLQDHGNPVRFRNIWYREIRKRPADGGTDGRLSKEATMAKRAEIAEDIREDAETLKGNDQMLRLLESLCYQHNVDALNKSLQMAEAFVKDVKAAPDKQDARKGEILEVYNALDYMVENKLIETPAAHGDLQGIALAKEWIKKK